jgi:hypothetical protein
VLLETVAELHTFGYRVEEVTNIKKKFLNDYLGGVKTEKIKDLLFTRSRIQE